MENIAKYRTFKYGKRTGFWGIYKFCINVHNWSYIPFSTNKNIGKSGRWTNYVKQTGNWHKTFSIKPKFFIWLMCCVKGNCTRWHKGVKYVSSITKSFLISSLEYQNIKKGNSYMYLVHDNTFFTWCCIWKKIVRYNTRHINIQRHSLW